MRRIIALALPVAVLLAFAAGPASSADQTVEVGDIWFCDPDGNTGNPDDCEITIDTGDTVTWDFTPATIFPHTVTHCGPDCDDPTDTPLFDSGIVPAGSTGEAALFEFTFNTPGEYLYYCELHPFQQRGRVIVEGDPPPCLPGDPNNDGTINAIDAALVLQVVAALLPIDQVACPFGLDANQDGIVNAIDAALILQFTAGLIETLPP